MYTNVMESNTVIADEVATCSAEQYPIIYQVEFKKLREDAHVPQRATDNSAGFDLYACEDAMVVGGAGCVMVPTGIAAQLPQGTYGRIAMRSGHARGHHLIAMAGVIDPDYTGEIKVLVACTKVLAPVTAQVIADLPDDELNIKPINVTHWAWPGSASTRCYYIKPYSYLIKKGERFAQLIVEVVNMAPAREVVELTQTYAVAHKGFGSTGIH